MDIDIDADDNANNFDNSLDDVDNVELSLQLSDSNNVTPQKGIKDDINLTENIILTSVNNLTSDANNERVQVVFQTELSDKIDNLKSSQEDCFSKKMNRKNVITSDSEEELILDNNLSLKLNTGDDSKSTMEDNVLNREVQSNVIESDSDDSSMINKRKINKNFRKLKPVYDSDSNDFSPNKHNEIRENYENENESTNIKPLTRMNSLIASDSDFDSDNNKDKKSMTSESPQETIKKKLFSGSSEENEDIFDTKKDKKKRKNKKVGKRITISDLMNMSSDENSPEKKKTFTKKLNNLVPVNDDVNKLLKSNKTEKSSIINDLIDSESDEDKNISQGIQFSDQEDKTVLSGDEIKAKSKKKTKEGPNRTSYAKKSKDIMQEISSETQRITREKQVSLPYHKPKQHTLEDFLNRKKAVNFIPKAPTIAAKLQMFSDIVGKMAEEKEKEAEVFFDSTDSEDDKDDTDYVPDPSLLENEEVEEVTNKCTIINLEKNDSLDLQTNDETSNTAMKSSNQILKSNFSENYILLSSVDTIEDLDDKEIKKAEKNDFLSGNWSNNEVDEANINDENKTLNNSKTETGKKDATENLKLNDSKDISEERDNHHISNLDCSKDILAKEQNLMDVDTDNIKWTEDESFIIDFDKSDKMTSDILMIDDNAVAKTIQSDRVDNEKLYDIDNENIMCQEKDKNTQSDSQSMVLNLDSYTDSIIDSEIIPENASNVKKKSELQLLKEKLLAAAVHIKPKLRGDPNMIIDLSDDVKPKATGVNNLINRFLKQNVKKPKTNTIVKLQMEDDVIILGDENENPKLKMPGVKLRLFKEKLKQKIISQRHEEWKKKEEEEKELSKKHKDVGDDQEENQLDEILDLDEEEDIEDEEESDLEEDDYVMKEKKRKKCAFADDEAEVSEDEEGNVDNNDYEEEEEEEEEGQGEEEHNTDEEQDSVNEEDDECIKKPKKLKRIIKAFDDDDDSNFSQPKTDEDEIKDSNWKSADTSADLFSQNSLSNGSNYNREDIPILQQPRNSSDEDSITSKSFQRINDSDKNEHWLESNLHCQNTERNSFTLPEDPPAHPKTSQSVKKPIDLNSWLSKQTKLFSTPSRDSVRDEELLDICSGNFNKNSQSQGSQQQQLSGIMSNSVQQEPQSSILELSGLVDKSCTQNNTDSQLMAICSGAFSEVSNQKKGVKDHSFEGTESANLENLDDEPKRAKDNASLQIINEASKSEQTAKFENTDKHALTLLSSSEDEEDNFDKKLKIKTKKPKPLVLSDEEDEENLSEEESEIEQEENEMEEHYIDYDSEENEVIVPAKNIRKEASKFLEHEAELSESDWDSADEDEKGLDRLEMEEGDKEDIDEDEVRDQLGKIHMKRILDEDQKNVRLLQDILFEEGDLHTDGEGRQRRFKWKNIDKIDNDENRSTFNDDINYFNDDDDNELKSQTHEQRKFIEMKSRNNDDVEDDFNDSEIFKVGIKVATKSLRTEGSVVKEITETTTTRKTEALHETSYMPLMLSSVLGAGSSSGSKLAKGSFLSRGREKLMLIASKLKENDVVLNKPNFAFQHISPSVNKNEKDNTFEEEEIQIQGRKRKSSSSTPVSSKKQKKAFGKSAKKLFNES